VNQREHQRAISAMVYFISQIGALISQYQSDSLATNNSLLGLEITRRWTAIFSVAASAFVFVHC